MREKDRRIGITFAAGLALPHQDEKSGERTAPTHCTVPKSVDWVLAFEYNDIALNHESVVFCQRINHGYEYAAPNTGPICARGDDRTASGIRYDYDPMGSMDLTWICYGFLQPRSRPGSTWQLS